MRVRSNLSSTRRSVAALRRAGRLDATDAGLVRLAETLAETLDDAVAGGEKVYAVGQLARVHLAVLQALDAAPLPPAPEDPFAAMLSELATPGAGASDYGASASGRVD